MTHQLLDLAPMDLPRAAHRRQRPEAAVVGAVSSANLLAMQRLAGNRATSSLVVQRCGPIAKGECPCEDKGPGDGGAATHEAVSSESDHDSSPVGDM